MSDIQAPTILNNTSQYSSVSNNMTANNCDLVENSILGLVNANANEEILNAGNLIDPSPIEKMHSEMHSTFGEMLNTEYDSSLMMPSHSLNDFLNANSSHVNFSNDKIYLSETVPNQEINGPTNGKNFNLNTGR